MYSPQQTLQERSPTRSEIASLRVQRVTSYVTQESSLLRLATEASSGPLYYLRSRDNDLEILGIGTSASFRANSLPEFEDRFGWLLPTLLTHPFSEILFLLGGTSFDTRNLGAEWSGFSPVHFLLPRKLHLRRGRLVEVYHLGDSQSNATEQSLSLETPINAKWRYTQPTFDGWCSMLEDALQHMARGSMKKVVLARRAVATLDHPVHPAHLLQRVLTPPQRVAGFAFAPTEDLSLCFFGGTPELLLTLEDRALRSEALAGTLMRTRTQSTTDLQPTYLNPTELPVVDPASSALQDSHKDQDEHQYVVNAIVERLKTVCAVVESSSNPDVAVLHDLYHLVTPIKAQLSKDATPFSLLALLHPSPAVGGTPAEAALKFITTEEPFERGWYAGTIGYISPQRSEFYVSLRSALLKGLELSAYVGAGIVSESVPAQEWEELNLKQRRMEECLR